MEGKDSFILYTKYIHTFNMLTNEQAGHLIKHILNYVNDLIPEEQEDNIEDPVVRIAWVSIKLDLKAALVKWRDTCKKRSDAGKKGGRPKKEEKQTKPKKANALFENQSKTKKADNDNEYDNEYDNELNNVSKDTMAAISNDNRQPMIVLPCLSNYNHPIFEDDIKHYKELYPAVDILQELKKMLGWLESNPSNRKTKNGIKAFITRWLSKVQDKAPKTESQNTGFGEYDVVGGFQRLGETDEEYEKRTGIKRYKPNNRNFDDPDGFGGNTL